MRVQSTVAPDLIRIDRASVKDQALEQLKRYIASGAVAAGQRLPSERDLAKRLGIGRNSVREALKVLEAMGITESRIGEGTFIVDQTGTSFGRTIGLSLATWGGTLVEILSARQMIEVEAAAVAAHQRDAQDLVDLETELDRMARNASPHDYLAADMQFHRLVSRATHNAIVAGIVANLIDMLEEVLREAHADDVMTLAEGSGTHRDIFAAIGAKDATVAGSAMRKHLQFSTEVWAAVASLGADRAGAAAPAADRRRVEGR